MLMSATERDAAANWPRPATDRAHDLGRQAVRDRDADFPGGQAPCQNAAFMALAGASHADDLVALLDAYNRGADAERREVQRLTAEEMQAIFRPAKAGEQ